MMGHQSRQMAMIFVDIESLIPETHLLRKIERMVSFDFIYDLLAPYYPATGRPSVDSVSMFKMLLIGYLYGIKSERRLVEEVQLNIAYRWFCGFELDDTIPNHSTFSKTRTRKWQQSDLFQKVFYEIVKQCIDSGLIDGEAMAADGSYIPANVSRESWINVETEVEQSILRNPFYKGAHLVCRTHQKGIRSNTHDIVPREEWEIIENCHEAIVSPEEWDKIQELIDRRPTIMNGNVCPFYNLFHGIIYCATCGKSMQVRYEKVGRIGKNRFTGEQREPIDKSYYICQTYNRLGKNACTSHKIEARDLYNLVLEDIQEMAKTALKDADAFYQRLSSRMERRYMADASQMQKECERLEVRNRVIHEMFLNLYTDKAKGILSEQRFVKLTATMEQEQQENQRRLQELLRMLQQSDAQESEVRTFIREIRQYATIQELDETVLNRLISRILVGEVKKVDGQKVQEVRIVYNFVGEIFY